MILYRQEKKEIYLPPIVVNSPENIGPFVVMFFGAFWLLCSWTHSFNDSFCCCCWSTLFFVILNIVLERDYKESPVLQLNHLQLATYYLSAFKIQLGGFTIKLVHFAKQIFTDVLLNTFCFTSTCLALFCQIVSLWIFFF